MMASDILIPTEVLEIIGGDGGWSIDDNNNRFYHQRMEDTSMTTSSFAGALWKCSIAFIPVDSNTHRIWNWWLDQLRGSAGFTMFPVRRALFLMHNTFTPPTNVTVVGEWETGAYSLMVTSPVAVIIPTWTPFNIMQSTNRKLHFTTRNTTLLADTPTLLHFSHGVTQGNNALTDTAYGFTPNSSVPLNFTEPLLSMRLAKAQSKSITKPSAHELGGLTFVEEI